MEIKDFFKPFLNVYGKDASIDTLYQRWQQYADTFGLKDLCINDYEGFDINEIIKNRVFCFTHENILKMKEAHQNLIELIPMIIQKIDNYYPLHQINFSIILYHGLGNSAGWVTPFAGKEAILFGIEKIAELNWHKRETLEALVSHELVHVVHKTIRGELEEGANLYQEGINRLYIEGFAQYYQSVFLGKNVESRPKEWKDSCFKQVKELKKCYIEALQNQEIGCKHFFGDWYNILGISDAGYFLGEQFIENLSKKYTMKEIALLDFNKIKEEIHLFLIK